MKNVLLCILLASLSPIVMAGDGGVIPLPAAAWFFSSGLICLALGKRKLLQGKGVSQTQK